ncbi:MAG: cell division protein ZipA C-terminal FtsZ-binding domain-containing protein [Usitatibacter sp.]
MSDLQLALLAGGAVFVLAVIAFNVWQEKRARGKAEKAFGGRPPDSLFDAPKAGERQEPVMGRMPAGASVEPVEVAPPRNEDPEELEAGSGPAAEISGKIDTVALILADDPIMREQLEPLIESLRVHRTPLHLEGIVDEQWHPIESSPRQSWRELRVGLQLASRAGPLAEEEIERFNQAIAEFAASVIAVSQRESPAAAADRAVDLDRFCAEADIEVAVNVVGQFGANLPVSRVKSLALEHGLSETASGELVSFAGDGTVEFTVRGIAEAPGKASPHHYAGLTFALDLPQVADPAATLADMVQVAAIFADNLTAQLVDDNRKPLTEAGLASLRRSLENIVNDMESFGVPAGGALARRLFS